MYILFSFIPLIIFSLICIFVFHIKISNVLISMLLGLLCIFPISLIQYFIPQFSWLITNNVVNTLVTSLLFYGFIEELFKTIFLLPISKKMSVFNFLMISFVFGLSVGCFENIIYFMVKLQNSNSNSASLLYSLILVRTFSSVIIHMVCSGLCGLFVYSVAHKNKKISCFVLAVLLHGFFDFFVGYNQNIKWFYIAVILLSILECRIKYQQIKKDIQWIPEEK